MLIQTRHTHHKALLRLLQHIATCKEGQIRVAALAEITGFSRAHFSRLFAGAIGESPAEFERRLRMERSCYLLSEHGISVVEASHYSEYANPEAFTRAFRSAYGCSPSQIKQRSDVCWRLPAPSEVHWLPTGQLTGYKPVDNPSLDVKIVDRPRMRLAVLRHVGSYGSGHITWSQVEKLSPERPWDDPNVLLLGVYHDDPHRFSSMDGLRSDMGYQIAPDQPPPPGMRCLDIPEGVYVSTAVAHGHEDYFPTWSLLNQEWLPRRGSRPANLPAIDEFESWPLPWEQRRARLMLGLDIELGYI